MTLKQQRFVSFASVTKMAHFAIALLLGASAVLSSESPCDDLRNSLLNAKQWTDHFSGQFNMGDAITLHSNYFKTVTMQLSYVTTEKVHRHVISAYPSGESHPRITVDGKSYKLHSLAISNLNHTKGTAALTITFYQEENIEPTREVLLVVPVLKVTDEEVSLNRDLTSTLTILRVEPEWKIKNVPFKWLQPLLAGVTPLTSTPEHVKVFMTGCQYVDISSRVFSI